MRLKPKAPTTGFVDGAWRPRSRDLSIELPALLAVLAVRLGRVERVTYNLTTWRAAPRRIDVDGRVVRLNGFGSQHAHTMDVIGADQQRLTLLVVPPETTNASAHRTLMAASQRGNIDTIEMLLTDPEPPAASRSTASGEQVEAEIRRWELEGGRLYEPVPNPQGRPAIQLSPPPSFVPVPGDENPA